MHGGRVKKPSIRIILLAPQASAVRTTPRGRSESAPTVPAQPLSKVAEGVPAEAIEIAPAHPRSLDACDQVRLITLDREMDRP